MMIAKDIDEYISMFPKDIQKLLQQMRKAIKKAAPQAEETINYAIPTFTLKGNLVHFAAFKNHIGFYPAPSGIEAFKKELANYKGAKGSVQFPVNEPLPLELVTEIVRFRVAENFQKEEKKKVRQPSKRAAEDVKKPIAKAAVIKQRTSLQNNSLPPLSAPAKRALENKGIDSLKQLSHYSETAISALHGMGPSSIPKLKQALAAAGLSFKK